MLEISFPMAFQRLDIRDGDLGAPCRETKQNGEQPFGFRKTNNL
jgi:hypothetical protein